MAVLNTLGKPIAIKPEVPPVSNGVVVIPSNKRYIFDVGDGLPDVGTMRVRVRASRVNLRVSTLQL